MAPPRLPPELNNDLTTEILLRVSPPDQPAHLVRAALVCKICKIWRRILSDSDFIRRHRAFHGCPRLLGFFYNLNIWGPHVPRFVATTEGAPLPEPPYDLRGLRILDCRHGRVLLTNVNGAIDKKFVVWDPSSNSWEELPAPRTLYERHYNAVVLCAATACDHRDCRGGAFLVVCLAMDRRDYRNIRAHVYSSEAHAWAALASARLDAQNLFFDRNRAVVARDGIYCIVDRVSSFLAVKYDLVKQSLSFIKLPHKWVPALMRHEDGSLGVTAVVCSRLYLWSRKPNADGVTGWVSRGVIKLTEVLPMAPMVEQSVKVIGFFEGVEFFFISTDVGAFIFELKSGRARKVGDPIMYDCSVYPFIKLFTTPDPA